MDGKTSKKLCVFCNVEVLSKNYSQHRKSERHLSNIKKSSAPINPVPESAVTPPPVEEIIKKDFLTEVEKIDGIELVKTFGKNKSFVTVQLRQSQEVMDLTKYKTKFVEVLSLLNSYHFKISVTVEVNFVKNNNTEITHGIQSPFEVIISKSETVAALQKCLDYISLQIDERYFKGSGLTLNKIKKSDLYLAAFKDTKGGHFITLPFKTNSVINVQSDDGKCFLWSLLAALHRPTIHLCRASSYSKYEGEIKIDNFPVCVKKDVPKIERENNLMINIFGLKTSKVNSKNILDYTLEPLYLSKCFEDENVIDLLYYKEHYMLLKNIAVFFRNDTQHRKYLCRRCMNAFGREETLLGHKKKCGVHDYCEIKMPEQGKSNLKFKNYSFKNRVPFVVYADFEATSTPVADKDLSYVKVSEKTKRLKTQKASAVGCYIRSDYPALFESAYFSYRGEDVVDYFCDWLLLKEEEFGKLLGTELKMVLTSEEQEQFEKAEKCYYCDKRSDGKMVRDHDHYSGKFRGAAHNYCNLMGKHANFVPIFFHNLSHYDAHLFIKTLVKKTLCRKTKGSRMKLLPKTAEEYISFQFGCLRFLDSFRFLQSSLDNITKSMTDDDFKITRQFYPDNDDFKLLRKKGAVPYSFYTSHKSYEEETLREDMFFNDLKNEMEPASVYERARETWDHFKIQNHGQFIDLYLKSDVLLLSDLFEKFRAVNLNYFQIDPCHCYSAPGLTWQAGLKYTAINLELLTEVDSFLLFEKAIRGGISGVMGRRYFKADDQHKLLYIDANNLYGWAMMQMLPESDFKVYEEIPDITKEDILSITEKSQLGFFFEVDLEYPEEIKLKSLNFPYCPESLFIPYEELSDYQKSLLGDEKRPKVEKLILTQNPKKNYIVHYRMLQFYLEQGMVLTKIHNVISFKQRGWLGKYIDFNTKQRMVAKTDFEKDFFKLMNNAFYGKTCENIRKRKDVELVTDPQVALRMHANPKFDSEAIFDEDLSAVMMRKTSMVFNKPIYIGATVLELSKLLMYKFYYETLQPYFKAENLELLYLDTDSFVLKIKTDDLTKDLTALKEHFDFSNYPKDHPLYDTNKKKVPGFFKDELAGEEMIEFIALKSKMYAYKTKEEEVKKLKGISKHVVKTGITFDDYYQSLVDKKTWSHSMRVLRSNRHSMCIEEVNKRSLNSFDDKRYILDGGISTVPYGAPGYGALVLKTI